MSRDEARQHIRAAQEAEIAGNREGAVRHLERAALCFVRVGQHSRAAQMYRNCLRLAPDRKDLQEALEKAETWAVESPPREENEGPPVVTAGEFDIMAVPRGPQKMVPGLEAWCSFCCRPTREVGELVAGPAGAFICKECLLASEKLLGVVHAPVPTVSIAPAPPRRFEPVIVPMEPKTADFTRRSKSWLGGDELLHAGRAALMGRGPSLILMGGEGTGKSALLDALADEFPDAQRADCATTDSFEGPRVLLEQIHLGDAETYANLSRFPFVATWRDDELRSHPLEVNARDRAVTLPVADVSLPPELRDVAALAFDAPDANLLMAIAERDIKDHDGPILTPAALQQLIKRAQKSPRGAKGLLAELGLLRTLPPGSPISPGVSRASRKKKA